MVMNGERRLVALRQAGAAAAAAAPRRGPRAGTPPAPRTRRGSPSKTSPAAAVDSATAGLGRRLGEPWILRWAMVANLPHPGHARPGQRAAYACRCVLILLPPSESKTGRSRGRPAGPGRLSFPELTDRRAAMVARGPGEVERPADAAATLGVSPNLTADIARNTRTRPRPQPSPRPTSTPACSTTRSTRQRSTPPPGAGRTGGSWWSPPSSARVRPTDAIVALPALDGGQPPRRRPARQRLEARAAAGSSHSRRPRRGRRLPLQHVCRGVGARGRARRPLGAGPGARRDAHGQAHPRPRGPPPVPGRARTRGRCRRWRRWWCTPSTSACTSPARTVSPGSSTPRPAERGEPWKPRDRAELADLADAGRAGPGLLRRDHHRRRDRRRAGVFDVAGHWAARPAATGPPCCGCCSSLSLSSCTIVLSLDTTAVLLTPVVIAVARPARTSRPCRSLMTTLWLANTASLLLPVSNLTNLLALHHFDRLGARPRRATSAPPRSAGAGLDRGHRRRARPAAPPDAARPLRAGRTARAARPRAAPRSRAAVCVALGPRFVGGLTPAIAAATRGRGAGRVVLGVRSRGLLRTVQVPWLMVLGVVRPVRARGRRPAGTGSARCWRPGRRHRHDAGRTCAPRRPRRGVGNAVNNLPAYLALEPVAQTDPGPPDGPAHRRQLSPRW